MWALWNLLYQQIGRFNFQGWLLHLLQNFLYFSIKGEQWRPWSDTAFCDVWSESALFAIAMHESVKFSDVFAKADGDSPQNQWRPSLCYMSSDCLVKENKVILKEVVATTETTRRSTMWSAMWVTRGHQVWPIHIWICCSIQFVLLFFAQSACSFSFVCKQRRPYTRDPVYLLSSPLCLFVHKWGRYRLCKARLIKAHNSHVLVAGRKSVQDFFTFKHPWKNSKARKTAE